MLLITMPVSGATEDEPSPLSWVVPNPVKERLMCMISWPNGMN